VDFSAFDQLGVGLILPDLWQQEAVRHLQAGQSVILDAPTGAGKTRVFELLVEGRTIKGQAVYTVPTRALANDKRREWAERGWDVGIATGDLAENVDAPVLVATLETQMERLHGSDPPALLVVDEYQMIGDRQRGLHYETAIAVTPPSTQLLLMSGSVANPREVAEWLERIGRPTQFVVTRERPVPLEEMPLGGLPRQAPRSVKGFWPRLAAGAILSELSPLLIFAPQRSGAEKLARQIASILPDDESLVLTPEEKALCGKDLTRVLSKRVAFHHSGLPYPARAGIVEPLAKAGRLHVIVATTGLAAGINFSVRSVAMAGTTYMDGEFPRELGPDEMLQMFGRAGRRGLDEIGFVIVTERPPRLSDACPMRLRRTSPVDWPTLLRVMENAPARGEPPFEAATKFCGRIFSKEPVGLGFLDRNVENEAPAKGPALGPARAEIRNAGGEWEAAGLGQASSAPLGEAIAPLKKGPGPATQSAPTVERLLAKVPGRLCRIGPKDAWGYGKECVIGSISADGGPLRPTKTVAKFIGAANSQEWSPATLRAAFAHQIEVLVPEAVVHAEEARGDTFVVRVDPDQITVPVHLDASGAALFEAEERFAAVSQATTFNDGEGGELGTRRGSAARAWRKLGLVEADGTVTDRGRIFSRFQGGEGLLIAAALEDPHYPIDELVGHLANVRAGRDFDEDFDGGGSDRLTHVAHQAFGATDYPGYLRVGLPTSYGRAASDLLEAWLHDRHMDFHGMQCGRGDLERVLSEWLSLLRHVAATDDLGIARWTELQDEARNQLRLHSGSSASTTLPEVPRDARSDRPLWRPRIS